MQKDGKEKRKPALLYNRVTWERVLENSARVQTLAKCCDVKHPVDLCSQGKKTLHVFNPKMLCVNHEDCIRVYHLASFRFVIGYAQLNSKR